MRVHKFFATIAVCTLAAAFLHPQTSATARATHPGTVLTPEIQSVLNAITPGNLRGNLSFLASDLLQGRYTPSPGLDIAAEFIASQFRAAGLEPGAPDFFQLADMVDRRMPRVQTAMVLVEGEETTEAPADAIAVRGVNRAAHIEHSPVVAFSSCDPALLTGKDLAGKAVVVPQPAYQSMPGDQATDMFEKARAFDEEVAASQASIEIVVGKVRGMGNASRLIPADEAFANRVPLIETSNELLQKWMEHPADGRSVSLDIPAAEDHRVTVKNVIAVLRGEDPRLKDTYVLVTAHYDHIGTIETARYMGAPAKGQSAKDRVYNGANDDGSGTVSVIEIGKALAKLKQRPKRSIVFITFFGEERGDLGSHYYGEHPAFPIAKTIADVNLEQVGRTDSTNGPQVNTASLTGFDYSDVTSYFVKAGRDTGVKVYLDKEASDAYFVRSDNAALALQGVPAHTLTVAFDYPDYHGAGDEWQKIDYDNMARVDRMIALGVLRLANSSVEPKWNAENPKTKPFLEAQEKLAGKTRIGRP